MAGVAVVTGSCGLVGSAVTESLLQAGMQVIGIDNDTRGMLFGQDGSTRLVRKHLIENWGGAGPYHHEDLDIRSEAAIDSIFNSWRDHIKLVVHTAGQPSHDWSAQAPLVDFDINARATLILLEAARNYAPDAVFVYLSTNKVYGDRINHANWVEKPTRWELLKDLYCFSGPTLPISWYGVTEAFPIDRSMHSPFGVSKLYGDLAVQEYGRYFRMNTVCFRCGCLTGGGHMGVQLHGFLAYLGHCIREGKHYTVFGYDGKQVRDNLHAWDLAAAIWEFYKSPSPAAVYNMGGGRDNSCSVIEAIDSMTSLVGTHLEWSYSAAERKGDHRWWITDTSAFEQDFPEWKRRWSLQDIYQDIMGVKDD